MRRLRTLVALAGLSGLSLAATPAPLSAPDVGAYSQLGQFNAPQGTVFAVVQVNFALSGEPVQFAPRRFYLRLGKRAYPISEATFLEESACEDLGLLRRGARVNCLVVFEAPKGLKTGTLELRTVNVANKPVTFSAPFKVTRHD
ncbi:MAG TPA: hypothetical protein VHN99_08910 [Deinococcales bacterium]|nr:hypothetical protein [Deinococcales bacterium]